MRVVALVTYKLKAVLKQPFPLAVMLLAPLFLAAFLSYGLEPLIADNRFVEPFQVALVDEDNSLETRTLIRQFEAADDFKKIVRFVRVDYAKGEQLLTEDGVAVLVRLPANFAQEMRSGKNVPIEVIGNAQRPLQASLFKSMLEAGLGLVTAAQSGINTVYHYLSEAGVDSEALSQTLKQLIADYSLQTLGRKQVFAEETVSALGGFSPHDYYAVAGDTVLLTFAGLLGLSQLGTAENEALQKRLALFGVRPLTAVVANFTFLSIVLLVQVAGVLLLLALLLDGSAFDLSASGSLLLLLVATFTAVLAVSALFTFFASLPLKEGAKALLALAAIVSMAVVGGAVLPLAYLPEVFETLSQFTLVRWIVSATLHALFLDEANEVWANAAVLSVSALLLLAAATLCERLKDRVRSR